MKACIVTGGRVNHSFVERRIVETGYDLIIAVDHGADFFAKTNIKPHHVVGDMDSATEVSKEEICGWEGCALHKYPAEKDETDTELAISLAIEKGVKQIDIYGATGTRIDHVLGNIHILKKALDANIDCTIVDENNRIRLIKGTIELKREHQYGKYVSLLPWMGEVLGVSLHGMKYPLENYTLPYGKALGVSNEIVEDTATIEIGSGIAVLIESVD